MVERKEHQIKRSDMFRDLKLLGLGKHSLVCVYAYVVDRQRNDTITKKDFCFLQTTCRVSGVPMHYSRLGDEHCGGCNYQSMISKQSLLNKRKGLNIAKLLEAYLGSAAGRSRYSGVGKKTNGRSSITLVLARSREIGLGLLFLGFPRSSGGYRAHVGK